jgi:hypothetical protein
LHILKSNNGSRSARAITGAGMATAHGSVHEPARSDQNGFSGKGESSNRKGEISGSSATFRSGVMSKKETDAQRTHLRDCQRGRESGSHEGSGIEHWSADEMSMR